MHYQHRTAASSGSTEPDTNGFPNATSDLSGQAILPIKVIANISMPERKQIFVSRTAKNHSKSFVSLRISGRDTFFIRLKSAYVTVTTKLSTVMRIPVLPETNSATC